MGRLLLVFLLVFAPRIDAWGVEGHRLVARLAAARLAPAAAARVAEILGPGADMQSIASWADQVRNSRKETGSWHYIDVPVTKPHVDLKRDCPAGNCVIPKIDQFERTVADARATPLQRREALMYLIHLVGDMHQPLHCSDNADKGGNDVKLAFLGRPTNLHSLWDTGLLARMGGEEALFADLDRDLTPKKTKKYAKGGVKNWAEQSHREAQRVVYGKLPKTAAGAQVDLGEPYRQAADPVVKEQLERAGARLAKVLNTSLK
jgi:hypothetical protein